MIDFIYMDFHKAAKEVRENGLIQIPGVYSKKKCEEYKKIADRIINRFIEKKSTLIHQDCQYIINPFRHDPAMMELLTNEIVDGLLKILLDPDYVLINATLNNRRHRTDFDTGYQKSLGDNWHTDSRYLYGERLDQGFGYLMVVMLDDFRKENGGTHYVPGSHKLRSIPEREGKYEDKILEGEAGTMVIMDSGVWHKAGGSSLQDRWAVFNLFGPWFMKPYYRFADMMGTEFGQKTNTTIRRLLHYNSIPPLNEDESLSTLIKEY